MERAMFAAGCFWGVEDFFRRVPGVLSTEVGFSGGWKEHPTYIQVCDGRTGHAETVYIVFDPDKVSYSQLLGHFWHIHDPTALNRQGPDIGTQYRSAIFYYNSEQRDMAMDSMRRLASDSGKTIVTEITPAEKFWRAEEYHQHYFEKNPGRGCHI
uniref:Peptide methionine sulfoxide reductase MsrA n=1 Tax=uncultured Thermoplasmata archaeon TaxID=376542 RepID=A0A871XZD3_9ARCH|nr:Peptide methionine sulfoxide reductase MsrA [uncultured Thermoplasmata archaeon]